MIVSCDFYSKIFYINCIIIIYVKLSNILNIIKCHYWYALKYLYVISLFWVWVQLTTVCFYLIKFSYIYFLMTKWEILSTTLLFIYYILKYQHEALNAFFFVISYLKSNHPIVLSFDYFAPWSLEVMFNNSATLNCNKQTKLRLRQV